MPRSVAALLCLQLGGLHVASGLSANVTHTVSL